MNKIEIDLDARASVNVDEAIIDGYDTSSQRL